MKISNAFRSIPFYSLNDALNADEVARQISFMQEEGMGGCFLHARGGLRTKYMSEEWFSVIESAIKHAEKIGFDIWLYDENGWPSGFADGKLFTEEFYVKHLSMQKRDSFDTTAYCVFAEVNGEIKRVDGDCGAEVYYCIFIRSNNSYVDVMNPALTDAFIKLVYDEYYSRFGKYFGTVIKGFFTDEPQYSGNGYPISSVSEAEFKKAYGYDMRDNLICLYLDTPKSTKFRHDYRLLCSRLFTENYTKRLYDWCEAHGCMFTGHTIDELTLFGQVRWNGGAMRFYEYEHVPGIDHLSRNVDFKLHFKQLSSVAEQLGKKRCITETFGASGHYSEPRDFKWIADMQFVGGVNLICQHLFPYSVRGIRKRDWPPFFSHHTSWINDSRSFNDRFAKIGQIVSEHPEKIETLLLHPIESCYLDFDLSNPKACQDREANFYYYVDRVVRRQVPHHFGDEVLMRKYAKVEDGTIKMGRYSYKNVIVSDQINISRSTYDMLREYIRQGGKIYVQREDFPLYVDGEKCDEKISSTATLDEILATSLVKVKEGESDIYSRRCGDYFYLVNTSTTTTAYATYVVKDAERVAEYDLLTDGETAMEYRLEGGSLVFSVSLPPRESTMLRFNSPVTPKPRVGLGTILNVTDKVQPIGVKDNYLLMDKFSYSTDGKTYEDVKAIYDIANKFMRERYDGDLYLKRTFKCVGEVGRVELLIEENDTLSVIFNGERVECKYVDDIYNVYDLTGKVKEGDNELVVKIRHYLSENVYKVMYDDSVLETLRNNLTLDTELENMFLRGDFAVHSENKLECDRFNRFDDTLYIGADKSVDIQNVTRDVYPFIKDKFVAKLDFVADDVDYSIAIDHTFDALTVKVNGKRYDMVVTDKADVSDAMRVGTNEIVFEFSPSSQLYYGPHRRDDISFPTCGPYSFGYEAISKRTVQMSEDIYTKKQGINGIYLIKNVR